MYMLDSSKDPPKKNSSDSALMSRPNVKYHFSDLSVKICLKYVTKSSRSTRFKSFLVDIISGQILQWAWIISSEHRLHISFSRPEDIWLPKSSILRLSYLTHIATSILCRSLVLLIKYANKNSVFCYIGMLPLQYSQSMSKHQTERRGPVLFPTCTSWARKTRSW